MQALFVGLNTVDIQFFMPFYPNENSKIKSEKKGIYTGGPATNAAVAYSHLGGKANLLTPVGKHEFSGFIQDDLSRNNIQLIDPIKNTKSEPVFACILTNRSNGARTICSYFPTHENNIFSNLDIPSNYNSILWDGFYPNLAEDTLKIAQKNNIPVIFDGGSWKPWLEKYLSLIEIAICSNDFCPPEIENNKEQIINYLLKKKVKHVIITRGSKSVLYANKSTSVEIPVPSIKAIDTTGAGDFFHGAFCYYYGSGSSIIESIQLASVIAAESCKYEGTRIWLEQLKLKNEEVGT